MRTSVFSLHIFEILPLYRHIFIYYFNKFPSGIIFDLYPAIIIAITLIFVHNTRLITVIAYSPRAFNSE